MSNSFTQISPDSTGKKIDTEQLTVGANTVERQRIQITGALADEIAAVKNTAPGTTDFGVVVRSIESVAARQQVNVVVAGIVPVTLIASPGVGLKLAMRLLHIFYSGVGTSDLILTDGTNIVYERTMGGTNSAFDANFTIGIEWPLNTPLTAAWSTAGGAGRILVVTETRM